MSSEESKMKVYFYYVRDHHRAPIITVCLAYQGDAWYRGVAICSVLDNPCKDSGRGFAFDRVVKALYSRRSQLPVKSPLVFDYLRSFVEFNLDRTGIVQEIMKGDFYKSCISPILTPFETNLVLSKP